MVYNGKTVTITGTVDAPNLGTPGTKYLSSTLSNAGDIYVHQFMGKIAVVLQKVLLVQVVGLISTWSYSFTQTDTTSTIDFGSTSRSFSVGTTLEANNKKI